jgi:hypothetical protein
MGIYFMVYISLCACIVYQSSPGRAIKLPFLVPSTPPKVKAALTTPARPSPATRPAATENAYDSKPLGKYFFHHQAVILPNRIAL